MDWLALTFSILGIFLNAKKNILCWPIWIASDILWIIFFILNPPTIWSSIILYVVFGVMNIYGWVEWNKSKNLNKENKNKVSELR
jgi:nicotinamide mononucleotide transporter